MRVLIVNTSEKTGGAAVAAKRLMEALNNNGVKAKMLVREKETQHIAVAEMPGKLRQRWNFLWERFRLLLSLHGSRVHLFDIDEGRTGQDITQTPEFKEADVIHLSWVNQGMLSLKGIRSILKSGKAVVWTMHDLWPAAAICHYARGCNAFKTACKNCPLLPGGGGERDLAHRVWRKKQQLYRNSGLHFVTCSRWLEDQAKQSALLNKLFVTNIPNPIDNHVFCPSDKVAARKALGLPAEGRIVLFVSQRVTDERKGMAYFVEAMRRLAEAHPELAANTAVAILGGHSEEVVEQLPLKAYPLGYVNEERQIVNVYNAADVYVLPSLEDNLPNTLMESLACGLPCVGFKVGGIPEMIDHRQNGYVAQLKNAADLAEGIRWVLCDADGNALCASALRKVATKYSQRMVALQYIEVYNQAIALKTCHL